MNNHCKKVKIDELFCNQYPESLQDIEVTTPSGRETPLGEIDHDDIRIYGLDVSLQGLKVEKVQTGRVFTICVSVITVLTIVVCGIYVALVLS